MNNKNVLTLFFLRAFTFLVVYMILSLFCYWIRNPELSQMQVFLNVINAVLWK